MKPRHAAALALVGWYMMLPPIPQDSSLLADPTPPLSVWFLKQSFDTAKECERARKTEDHEAELQMHDLAKSHAIETNMERAQFLLQRIFSQCIATNDPRLNEN
jgi:hypothetical protein